MVSPRQGVWCCSRWAWYGWVSPLLLVGSKRSLQETDVWPLEENQQSAHLFEDLSAKEAEQRGDVAAMRPGWRLLKLLFGVVGRKAILAAVFAFVYAACQMTHPILLREMVQSVQDEDGRGLWLSFCLFGMAVLAALCNHAHLYLAFLVGQSMRGVMITAVYRRGISLTLAQRRGLEVGEVVNLMSNDTQKLFDVMPFLNMGWTTPLQVIAATTILVTILGPSVLVGVFIIVAVAPLTAWFAKITSRVRAGHMAVTDARVKLCSEVLHNIKTVKVFAWEEAVLKRIFGSRAVEIAALHTEANMFARTILGMVIVPSLAAAAAIIVHNQAGNTITAADAFSVVAFFNILRFPLNGLGQFASIAVQSWVALTRLGSFLYPSASSPQSAAAAVGHSHDPEPGTGESLVDVTPCHMMWAKGDTNFGLEVPSRVTVNRGDLLSIVGGVGSGKSTFVNGLLGELHITAPGTAVTTRGKVSYAGQQAWIINATVKDNILFGEEFDADWYNMVLDCCCLLPDLATLPHGDGSWIGEKGVTLSGGQKARVALARAVYARADVLILDDPLSALDAHTGARVFDKCLGPSGICRASARILVTHATQYLGAANAVMVVHNGRVGFLGTYMELQEVVESGDLELDAEEVLELTTQDEVPALPSEPTLSPHGDGKKTLSRFKSTLSSSMKSLVSVAQEHSGSDLSEDVASPEKVEAVLLKPDAPGKPSGNIMSVEDRSEGAVSRVNVEKYVEAMGGWPMLVALVFVFVGERCAFVGIEWWLSVWVSEGDEDTTDLGIGTHDDLWWIGWWAAIMVTALFVTGIRIHYVMYLTVRAASHLFGGLINSVFRAPMSWFDTTPVGRVVGRVSHDVEIMDSNYTRINGFIASMFWLLGGVSVMVGVAPYVAPVLVAVLFTYYKLLSYSRASIRELQRLDNTTRSPIQSIFSESLQGSPTIRAFRATSRFVARGHTLVDANSACVYAYQASNRWLGVRLECMGAIVTLAVALAVWLARDSLSAALSGLALNWAFNMTVSLHFVSLLWSETEAKFTSVERILYFRDNLPTERPRTAPAADAPPPTGAPVVEAPAEWPQRGVVELRDVVMRYRPELEPALRGASVHIRAGERIGVVGRTGAGKSSLTVALWRLVELESGAVLVDGVDTSTLPLAQLRRSLTLIPQDPVVFSGTLRTAVDPFQEHTDDEIWECLDIVAMRDKVDSMGGGLGAHVAEGGENFSVGERALLCLARALLRKPRVLCMDEATAAVDMEVDAHIQRVVREHFAQTTLIVIAHRLHTVMECDRVLVMSEGRVGEVGPPHELLAVSDSALSGLVDACGPAASASLREAALAFATERPQADTSDDTTK